MLGPTKMQLCSIEKTDHQRLCDIHQACFGNKGWDLFTFEKMLDLSGGIGYKLEVASRSVGFILYQNAADNADIVTICVDPEVHSKGYGSFLLCQSLKELQQKDIDLVTLEVEEENKAAQKLYENAGFKKISERKNYYASYTNQAKNAYVFQISLKNAKFSEDLK